MPGLAAALAAQGIDPSMIPNLPQYQTLIDEIRAIREATQLPAGWNPFAADFFLQDPNYLASGFAANQVKYGIPTNSQQHEANRFMLPGVSKASLRVGV